MKKIIIIALGITAALIIGLFCISVYETEEQNMEKTVKVGIILNGLKNDRSWSQSHYDGIAETSQQLGFDILCRECVSAEDAPTVIKELIASECEIVIANSAIFGDAVIEAAEKYPHIYFYHASGTAADKNLASYFGRMYQIRYLTGIAAGLQTETNEIGYTAAFPISEVNRGINAFTLGVQSVNPDAVVYVNWINSWNDDEAAREATEKLIENHNIDVLAMHTDSMAPFAVAEENGIMSIGYNFDNSSLYPDSCLTSAVWDWEQYYTPHLRKCLQGKFTGKNCWEGIDTGIVEMAPLCPAAKEGIEEKTEQAFERLASGVFDVFYGPVYDNEGNLRIAEGESMTDDSMLNEFDWYVKGVVIDEQ